MATTKSALRFAPRIDVRAAIMSDIAHEWTNVCGPSATVSEVASKWRLDPRASEQLLAELTERGILARLADGSYRYAAHDWRGDGCSAADCAPTDRAEPCSADHAQACDERGRIVSPGFIVLKSPGCVRLV